MNSPRREVSVLVERLLDLAPEQWQAALAEANISPALSAEVLAILNAVSARLQGWLPTTTNLLKALGQRSAGNNAGTPPSIPGYEILEELGRGGMGVVYKARQASLQRLVALKTIRSGADADAADRARFLAEAEAVARVQHPHIVTLYEFGGHEHLLYFTLECVAGGSLAQKLAGRPLEARQAAHLVEQVADAIQFAHEQGILHRDLKPGNVLLTADGIPKVSDFGLAKRLALAAAAPPEQTRSGALLGTPSYMAPELVTGQKDQVGPATDIYGLGAILYECLTGRPPFCGVTTLDTLGQVRAEEPVAPHRLNRSVPRDLETICLKCLHKDPARRYPSAQALAEDLRRFQEYRPIVARPIRHRERAWRWCRRNPAVAALAAVSLVAVVLLSLGGLWLLRAHEIAQLHAQTADAQRYASLVSSTREGISQGRAGWTWAGLTKLTEAAGLRTSLRNVQELRSDAATCLAGVDIRKTAVLHPAIPQCALAWSPDGKVLAAARLRGGEATVPRTVLLLDAATGTVLRTLTYPADAAWCQATARQDGTRSLAFSGDGRRLAIGTRSGWVHAWDFTAAHPVASSWRAVTMGDVDRLLFNLDGEALLTLCRRTKQLVRWAVRDGQEQARYEANGEFDGLVLHPDGRSLAMYRYDRILMFDPESLSSLEGPCNQNVVPYCFSPDGRFVAGEIEGRILLLEVATGQVVRAFQDPGMGRAHEKRLEHISFNADGSLLLSASYTDEDRTLKLWEVASGRLVIAETLGTRGFHAVAWHPDGRSFAVSLDDEQIALYEVAGLREQTFQAQDAFPLTGLQLSPGGSLFACLSAGAVSVRETASGRLLVQRPRVSPEPASSLAVHPHAREVVYGTDNMQIASWNGASNSERVVNVGLPVGPLAFTPDGKTLWAITDGDRLRAWSWQDGQLRADWHNDVTPGLGALYCLATGHRWVLAGGRDGGIRVFQARDARLLTTWSGPGSQVRSVALSPDETLAALGTQQGTVRLVRVASGEKLLDLDGHHGSVEALVFSPDGRLLATGSRDRSIRLYHVASRQGDLFEHRMTLRSPGPITNLAFHPDALRLLFLVQHESALRVWHLDRLRERLALMGLIDDWPSTASPAPS